MTISRRLSLAAAIAVVAGGGAVAPLGAAASVTGVGRPAIAQASLRLSAVDAITPDDVWAVGTRSATTPFMRHWDGTRWHPSVGPSQLHELYAVEHASADSVWAAGRGGVMHWDGSTWQTSYNAPGQWTSIKALAVISDDDIWGVGDDLGGHSVKVHWDGSTWAEVGEREPDAGFFAVDADGADDVWAVGSGGLVEHYDGSSWERFDGLSTSYYAVSVVSPQDVWIAGGFMQAEMLHWNGHDLVSVDVPTLGISSGLNALTVVSPTDIWAAGKTQPAQGNVQSLLLHWNGRQWHVRPTPDSRHANYLNGVSAANTDDAYAVGTIRETKFHDHGLTLHWDGSSWTRVP